MTNRRFVSSMTNRRFDMTNLRFVGAALGNHRFVVLNLLQEGRCFAGSWINLIEIQKRYSRWFLT